MNCFGNAVTDIGIKKTTNQDSIALEIAQTNYGKAILLIVCDGMGGLEKGEVASSTVITQMIQWFKERFPLLINKVVDMDRLKLDWETIILNLNKRIMEYGVENGIKLGTTLTMMLIFEGRYYIVHVGDSRAYEITNDSIDIITKDQTFIAREIELGRMTAQEALNDPRRNMLLQCIGASNVLEPAYYQGDIKENVVYMLCSDGFRHLIQADEIKVGIRPDNLIDDVQLKKEITSLIELNKQRGETDNISAVAVKLIRKAK